MAENRDQNAATRRAAIEAGDRADARLRQRGRQRAQIVGTDGNIAVGHNDERMASDFSHIDKVGDLAVAAMHGAVDDQLKIEPGIPLHQRFHHRNCAVVGILDAENDLDTPLVIVIQIGFDVLSELRLGAEQRLQDRDIRPCCWSSRGRRAGRTTGPLPRRRPR